MRMDDQSSLRSLSTFPNFHCFGIHKVNYVALFSDPVYLDPELEFCFSVQLCIIVFTCLVISLFPASATASYYVKEWSNARTKIASRRNAAPVVDSRQNNGSDTAQVMGHLQKEQYKGCNVTEGDKKTPVVKSVKLEESKETRTVKATQTAALSRQEAGCSSGDMGLGKDVSAEKLLSIWFAKSNLNTETSGNKYTMSGDQYEGKDDEHKAEIIINKTLTLPNQEKATQQQTSHIEHDHLTQSLSVLYKSCTETNEIQSAGVRNGCSSRMPDTTRSLTKGSSEKANNPPVTTFESKTCRVPLGAPTVSSSSVPTSLHDLLRGVTNTIGSPPSPSIHSTASTRTTSESRDLSQELYNGNYSKDIQSTYNTNPVTRTATTGHNAQQTSSNLSGKDSLDKWTPFKETAANTNLPKTPPKVTFDTTSRATGTQAITYTKCAQVIPISSSQNVKQPFYLKELRDKIAECSVQQTPSVSKHSTGNKGQQTDKKLVSILKKPGLYKVKEELGSNVNDMYAKFHACVRSGRRKSSLQKTESLKSLIGQNTEQ